jgi:hypothetical protein
MAFRPLGSFADEMDIGESNPVAKVVQKAGQATKNAAQTTAQSVKQQVGVNDAAATATSGFLDALYGSSDPGDEPSPDNNTGVISHQQQKPQHGTAAPTGQPHGNNATDPAKQHDKKRIEELEAEIRKYAQQREQRDEEREQVEEQEKQMEELKIEDTKKNDIALNMAKKKTETFRGAGG